MRELIYGIGTLMILGCFFGIPLKKSFRAILGAVGAVCLFCGRLVWALMTWAFAILMMLGFVVAIFMILRSVRNHSYRRWR